MFRRRFSTIIPLTNLPLLGQLKKERLIRFGFLSAPGNFLPAIFRVQPGLPLLISLIVACRNLTNVIRLSLNRWLIVKLLYSFAPQPDLDRG
jgi:hypothetical protein